MPFTTNCYRLKMTERIEMIDRIEDEELLTTCIVGIYDHNFILKDHAEIMDSVLYWNYIPVELRKIIGSYFGLENEIYSVVLASAKVFNNRKQTNNINYTAFLPGINYDPEYFPRELRSPTISISIAKNEQRQINPRTGNTKIVATRCIIGSKLFSDCLKKFIPNCVTNRMVIKYRFVEL